MTVTWTWLLLAALATGFALVASLVVPRAGIPLATMALLAGMTGMFFASRTLGAAYGTVESWLVALLFCVAGVIAGYRVAAALLTRLTPPSHIPTFATHEDRGLTAVVVLDTSEPERYHPRSVSAMIEELGDDENAIPALALPLVFATVRARYRATGDVSPAAPLVRSLTAKVATIVRRRLPDASVVMASVNPVDNLAGTVAHLAESGVSRVAVVAVGSPEVGGVVRSFDLADSAAARETGVHLCLGQSIWSYERLSDELAGRVLATATAHPVSSVGVVLVSLGYPPGGKDGSREAEATEHCFDQRVRMVLTDAGFAIEHVRQAWMDWREPTVTEAVRHLAALGCTHIVVAPATIAMPGVRTTLDLEAATSLARVPQDVTVVTMAPWGDTDALAQTIAASAFDALGLPKERDDRPRP